MKFKILFFVFTFCFFLLNNQNVKAVCTTDYAPVCGNLNYNCNYNLNDCKPVLTTFINNCTMLESGATLQYTGECTGESGTITNNNYGICTADYSPVCGEETLNCIQAPCPTVKKTFSNMCTLNNIGAKFLYNGECTNNICPIYDMPYGGWCPNGVVSNTQNYDQNGCPLPPTCNYSCTTDYSPVCGKKDGNLKTYSNDCYRKNDNAIFQYNGTCGSVCSAQYDPVCGKLNSSLKTYSNECYLNKAGAEFISDGECSVNQNNTSLQISSIDNCEIGNTTCDNKTIYDLPITLSLEVYNDGDLPYYGDIYVNIKNIDSSKTKFLKLTPSLSLPISTSTRKIKVTVSTVLDSTIIDIQGRNTLSMTIQDKNGNNISKTIVKNYYRQDTNDNVCTTEYDPVCASYDVCSVSSNNTKYCSVTRKTFSNACQMNNNNATFVHAGVCNNTDLNYVNCPVYSNIICNGTLIASTQKDSNGCLLPPTCTTNGVCSSEYEPVCGIEKKCYTNLTCINQQKTYENICQLQSAGASYLRDGTCPTQNTVTTSNYTVNNLQNSPAAGFEQDVLTNKAPSNGPFSDINLNTVQGQAAKDLYERGIIGGFPDGEFKGSKSVSRAGAAKFLIRASGLTFNESDLYTIPNYSDLLVGQWYIPYVRAANNYGIINGYDNGKFGPEETVKIGQFVKMLTKTFNLAITADERKNPWFTDYMQVIDTYELFPGRSSSNIDGYQVMTRNDVAVAIYQFLKNR